MTHATGVRRITAIDQYYGDVCSVSSKLGAMKGMLFFAQAFANPISICENSKSTDPDVELFSQLLFVLNPKIIFHFFQNICSLQADLKQEFFYRFLREKPLRYQIGETETITLTLRKLATAWCRTVRN